VLLIVLETTQASIQKIEFTLQRPWRFIWFGCADHILPEVSILCYNVNYSPAKKNRTGNLDMHRLQQLERLPTTKRKRTWTEDDFAVLTSKQVVWKNFGNFQHSVQPNSCIPNDDVSKMNNEVCTRSERKQKSLNGPLDVCRDNIVNNMMISWVQSISYWSRNYWTEQYVCLPPGKWVSSSKIMTVR